MQYNPDKLLGTKYVSASDIAAIREARESFAYYNREPYPIYNFGPTIWSQDEPLPAAPPFTKIIVDQLAAFTFSGAAPVFTIPDNDEATAFLQDVIKRNDLDSKWVERAQILGNNGTIAFKFSHDPDDSSCPVKISCMDCPQQVRFIPDPFDSSKIAMAIVEFKFQDPSDSVWYEYREEWTTNTERRYKPRRLSAEGLGALYNSPDNLVARTEWEIEYEAANVFGVIPFVAVKCRAMDGLPTGKGDCWGTFRDQDELASTFASMRRYNKVSSNPQTVAIDADTDNTDPLAPGEILLLRSGGNGENQAKFQLIEPLGNARQWVAAYVEKCEALLNQTVGKSLLDPASFANTGQVTLAATTMLYRDTISTCDQKRAQWTISMTRFFTNLLIGMKNVRASVNLANYDPTNQEVSVSWGQYFTSTDADLSDLTDRTILKVQNGLLSKERAAKDLATREGTSPQEIELIVKEVSASTIKNTKVSYNANSGVIGTDTDTSSDPMQLSGELVDSAAQIVS